MATSVVSPSVDRLAGFSPANLGLVGQMATSWGLTGGLGGAVVVCVLMVTGQLSASFALLTTTMFFIGGWLVGFLHGGILGYLGRPLHVSRLLGLKRLGLAALYALPTMLLGWCLAISMSIGAVGVVGGRHGLLAFGVVGGLGLATALTWALVEGWRSMHHLSARWPGAGAAMTLLGLAFFTMLPFFLVLRPPVWIIGVRPTEPLAALMAMAATIWIGGPLAAVGVLLVRAWRKRRPPAASGGQGWPSPSAEA